MNLSTNPPIIAHLSFNSAHNSTSSSPWASSFTSINLKAIALKHRAKHRYLKDSYNEADPKES